MAYVTVAEAIVASLSANWSLLAPISAAEIHFDDGWFDKDHPDLQITVYGPISSENQYFGPPAGSMLMSITTYANYEIHVWVRIPRGADGDTEETQGERMRREVHRILNEQRESHVPPINLVYPLGRGSARHEYNQTPKVVHYIVPTRVVYAAIS